MLVDGVACGIKGGAALFYFFGDQRFVIFPKDKGEEEGGVDAELRFAPTVHLFECLDDPVMASGIFLDPVVEGGEHGANEIGFLKPVIDLFGVSAKEEFLNFFIHAGGAGLLEEGALRRMES